MRTLIALFALSTGLFSVQESQAAFLQVSPVTLDLTAPAQTASVNLRNNGDRPVNVQVRVYRWTQNSNQDFLTPATDVVASPPAATLQPGTTYTIRVARTAAPVESGEETYRLLIDELPEINVRRRAESVNLAIQYSIPVFFSDRGAGADLHWKVEREGNRLAVEVTNTGNRHAKIADLAVTSPSAKVSLGEGLNGYALPGATRRWTVTSGAQRILPGSNVSITAAGNDFAVREPVVVGRQ
ncbi:molecular chaperone [Phyllobacterium sp. 628]|nr:molecular chaperone [Phyllobacterium sp. 628]